MKRKNVIATIAIICLTISSCTKEDDRDLFETLDQKIEQQDRIDHPERWEFIQ